MKYDLAIIGGGTAGYKSAGYAAEKGLSVVLFEIESLGGVCLNRGCIPTKTLLYSAKRYNHFKDGTKYGVSCENPQFNLEKILQRKTKIIRKLTAGVRSYLSEAGVTVVAGEAFVEKYEKDNISVRSGEESFSAKNLILATGSEVSVPPVPGLDKVRYMTSDEALSPQEIGRAHV